MKHDVLGKLKVRVNVEIELNGRKVMDFELFKILKAIDLKGSIIAASRALGIPYAKAWEKIHRAERELGIELVRRARAGKMRGARLTREGKLILSYYEKVASKYGCKTLNLTTMHPLPEVVICGSHDLLFEYIVGKLRENKYDVEVSWLGSLGGLASLMLGEVDLVPFHLHNYIPNSELARQFDTFMIRGEIVIVRGYMRQIGLACDPTMEIKGFENVIEGKLRIVNRIKGSGTRACLESLIREYARKHEMRPEEVRRKIIGYENEVRTHWEVVKSIIDKKADVGLTVRAVAEMYGLFFKPVKWEWYDFIIPRRSFNKRSIKDFIRILKSNFVRKMSRKLPGYKVTNTIGEIIYKG